MTYMHLLRLQTIYQVADRMSECTAVPSCDFRGRIESEQILVIKYLIKYSRLFTISQPRASSRLTPLDSSHFFNASLKFRTLLFTAAPTQRWMILVRTETLQ
jgi:hypothetical protein